MASFNSAPSQTPIASTAWKPGIVLGIGDITDKFPCIGHHINNSEKRCENGIKKDNRTRAKEILLSMSTTPASPNTFEEYLKELLDQLFCWGHKKQVDNMRGKWTRAITDFVSKGGDDTIGSLCAQPSDLTERMSRLANPQNESGVGNQVAVRSSCQ